MPISISLITLVTLSLSSLSFSNTMQRTLLRHHPVLFTCATRKSAAVRSARPCTPYSHSRRPSRRKPKIARYSADGSVKRRTAASSSTTAVTTLSVRGGMSRAVETFVCEVVEGESGDDKVRPVALMGLEGLGGAGDVADADAERSVRRRMDRPAVDVDVNGGTLPSLRVSVAAPSGVWPRCSVGTSCCSCGSWSVVLGERIGGE